MRLSPTQVKQTLRQLDAAAVPDDHPSIPDLSDTFGDHTFFLNDDGLHVVEAIGDGPEPQGGVVIKVAAWIDKDHQQLSSHPAEPTHIVVPFKVN